MGIKLVKQCYENWGDLPATPFRLLVGMASTAYDRPESGKPAAVYFAGLEETMKLAGAKKRGALAALAILRDRGAVELIASGRPGRNATFRLNCGPTQTGAQPCTHSDETGAQPCTNGCTVTTRSGAQSRTPRNKENLIEEEARAMSEAYDDLGGRGDPPPKRFPDQCLRHQARLNAGDDFEACLGCRDIKASHEQTKEAEAKATADKRAEGRRLIDLCPDCSLDGWIETPNGEARCAHPKVLQSNLGADADHHTRRLEFWQSEMAAAVELDSRRMSA
ncbi:hypothetical protein [Demequina capsici]|uniref:Uncharacterized protein n=1 Tax=Demequina capsici TaxID=3075620 RepID=A0AA96J7W6_9MICO|nr:hypothetical protein [Demequina sp. OYTSA14]WNM25647.1 hypothetical protein RN606_05720 [Demequina sp. OYTSA14]